MSLPNTPNTELLSALAAMFESGKYSDLTITCCSKTYPVHRALLASRSSFFEGACNPSFQELQSGRIDLSHDDPDAVECMLHYFYHLDYLSAPPSCQTSDHSVRVTSSHVSRVPARRQPTSLSQAMVEDPLLAMFSAASPAPPSNPLEQPDDQDALDWSAKLSDTPMTIQFPTGPSDDNLLKPNSRVEQPHLIMHAKVYAIAEKYGIDGLKTLARDKFANEIEIHISSEELPEACQEVYESTVDSDRGLRDIVIQAFRTHSDLAIRKDMELAVKETPGLAFELFKMASGLPVASCA